MALPLPSLPPGQHLWGTPSETLLTPFAFWLDSASKDGAIITGKTVAVVSSDSRPRTSPTVQSVRESVGKIELSVTVADGTTLDDGRSVATTSDSLLIESDKRRFWFWGQVFFVCGADRVDEDAQLAAAAGGTVEETTIGDAEEAGRLCWSREVSMETETACKGADAICERWAPILSAEEEEDEEGDFRICELSLVSPNKGTHGLETAAEIMYGCRGNGCRSGTSPAFGS